MMVANKLLLQFVQTERQIAFNVYSQLVREQRSTSLNRSSQFTTTIFFTFREFFWGEFSFCFTKNECHQF